MVADGHPVVPGRARLAARLDVVLEHEFGEIGDGGRGRRLRRLRVLAPLDAIDDHGGLAPAVLDGIGADPPERHPLQAGRPPGLDDVELAPRRMHPHPEAGQVAVPEDRVLAAGLEPVHNPLGQPERAALRHGSLSPKTFVRRMATMRKSMTTPRPASPPPEPLDSSSVSIAARPT